MAISHAGTKNAAVAALVAGRNRDPFALLGPHVDEDSGGLVVRAFQPVAKRMELRIAATGELVSMTKLDRAGLFEARPRLSQHPPVPMLFDYRLRITYPGDHVLELDDPYRYG